MEPVATSPAGPKKGQRVHPACFVGTGPSPVSSTGRTIGEQKAKVKLFFDAFERENPAPATPRNGLFASTVAWVAVLL